MEIPLPLTSWFVLQASYSQQNLLPQLAPRRETFLRGASSSPGFLSQLCPTRISSDGLYFGQCEQETSSRGCSSIWFEYLLGSWIKLPPCYGVSGVPRHSLSEALTSPASS